MKSKLKKSTSAKKISKKPVKKKPVKKKKNLKKPSDKSIKKSVKKSVKKLTKKSLEAKKVKKQNKNVLKKTIPQNKKNSHSFLNQLEQELERIFEKDRKISIKNSEGYEYCLEENCDQSATTGGYCRYHYIAHWSLIKEKTQILNEKKLNQWIKDIIQNHSFFVLNFMIRDLSNEKDFSLALSEMKISSNHSNEVE